MKAAAIIAMLLFGLLILYGAAEAECYCTCVNNEKTKVCENSWDSNYVFCYGWCSG